MIYDANCVGSSEDSNVSLLGLTAASYVRRYNLIGADSSLVDRNNASEAAKVKGYALPSDTVH